MAAQLNRKIQKDSVADAQKRLQVGAQAHRVHTQSRQSRAFV